MIGIEFTLSSGDKDSYDPVEEEEFETGQTIYTYEFYVGGTLYSVPKNIVEYVRKYELCRACGHEYGICEHDEGTEAVSEDDHPSCPDCFEGMYPHYGLAPHRHDTGRTGSIIGSTVIDTKPYPDNFSEDPEAPGCGVWTHCLTCSGDA